MKAKLKNIKFFLSAISVLIIGLSFSFVFAIQPAQGKDSDNSELVPVKVMPERIIHSKTEESVLETINKIRKKPGTEIKKLGLKLPGTASEKHELLNGFDQALGEVETNGNLLCITKNRARQLIASNFSFKTITPGAELLIDKGYLPETLTESNATILFANYLEPAKAVSLMLKGMIRDELKEETDLKILNPDVNHIGISFNTTTVKRDQKSWNSYFMVISFSSEKTSMAARTWIELTNQARANPLSQAARQGIHYSKKDFQNEPFEKLLNTGQPPLIFDEALWKTAYLRNNPSDMQDFAINDTSELFTLEERIALLNMKMDGAKEIVLDKNTNVKTDGVKTISEMFREQFRAEAVPGNWNFYILNASAKKIGAVYTRQIIETDEMEDYAVHTLVMDTADRIYPDITSRFGITGHVYVDKDKNCAYSSNEGVCNIQVSCLDEKGNINTVFTNPAGGFSFVEFAPGSYHLFVLLPDDEMIEKEIEVNDKNIFVAIPLN